MKFLFINPFVVSTDLARGKTEEAKAKTEVMGGSTTIAAGDVVGPVCPPAGIATIVAGTGVVVKGTIDLKRVEDKKDEEKGRKLLDRLVSRYGRDGANSALQGIIEEGRIHKEQNDRASHDALGVHYVYGGR